MQTEYKIRSDRYGHTHKFLREGELYRFIPQEDWMPIYAGRDPKTDKIQYVDTEGGPFLSEGWSDGNIEIVSINENLQFELREVQQKKP